MAELRVFESVFEAIKHLLAILEKPFIVVQQIATGYRWRTSDLREFEKRSYWEICEK